MSTHNLVDKVGLAHRDASGIEAAHVDSGGRDAKADHSDLRRESEASSANIEKVAQLAKLYAAGTPPDKEFRVIKERVNVASDEVADKDNGAQSYAEGMANGGENSVKCTNARSGQRRRCSQPAHRYGSGKV